MRKSGLIVFCFAFTLSACTMTTHNTPSQNWVKPGNEVTIYPQVSAIKRPYRIIGKERVSRYNLIGLKREDQKMDELMKNLAASMGGDAIINQSSDSQKVEGTVISFEKVLL